MENLNLYSIFSKELYFEEYISWKEMFLHVFNSCLIKRHTSYVSYLNNRLLARQNSKNRSSSYTSRTQSDQCTISDLTRKIIEWIFIDPGWPKRCCFSAWRSVKRIFYSGTRSILKRKNSTCTDSQPTSYHRRTH